MSKPLVPLGEKYLPPERDNEPLVPAAFTCDGERYAAESIVRGWRSTKDDRGDTYLKRHWYELALAGGGRATIYYDRAARRGQANWWLYTLDP